MIQLPRLTMFEVKLSIIRLFTSFDSTFGLSTTNIGMIKSLEKQELR